MAEKNIKWTKQQQQAIRQRGSDVLVTASAGTGKTAVLSGRCVDIISDKSICPDVGSVLVLTFTDAAAEQMRLRIAEQLRNASLQKPDPHLRRQLMLLDGADIGTIHSFCKRLITEFFYKLGLDPTFRIIDADEAALLKAETFEKCLDWAWQQSNLTAALQQLLRRRDLRANFGFLSRIMALSNFLDGVVSRLHWYERASVLAEALDPLKSNLGEKQKQIIADRLNHILARLQHAQKLYDQHNPAGDWSKKLQETHITAVAQCKELLQAGRWDKCAEKISSFKKPTTYTPKNLDKPLADLIAGLAKKAIDDFANLTDFAIINPDYLDRVGLASGMQTKVIIEILKKFDSLYSRAKRSINSLDFADLERLALKLLTEENSADGKLMPSETALALRRRYRYIFVDEYQDINPVQQAILDTLSSAGSVFVVGDVKQSIYAFRGARPEIFLSQLKHASLDPASAPNSLRVDLNTNFRSAKGILDFVNKLFSRIMTAPFTTIDYDESARLRPASEPKSTSETGPVVEFHILDEEPVVSLPALSLVEVSNPMEEGTEETDNSKELNPNIITSRQRQAAAIARRIKQMVGTDTGKCEFQIFDKEHGIFRNIEYRDIVILMRSPAERVNDYIEVLRLAGLPVSSEFGSGYFETTEITDILCLLKILDNPQRDIELAAVLRSPFFSITDTELAEIKLHSKIDRQTEGFYNCVLQYCANGSDTELAEKLKKILAQIETWRTLGRRGSLADLIWLILRQTAFLSFVSALPNGQSRRANLLKLHNRAIQFENFAGSSGSISLRRFVEFIEKLRTTAADWAKASPEAVTENAIRITSVHKSKGLEFPVVFLAELNSPFNKEDVLEDCIADDAALGLQIIDRKSNSKLSSLAHQVIAEDRLKSALAEEMRILYVATTRARDRLILTACEKAKHCRNIIRNGFYLGTGPVPDWQLRSCRNALEWFLYALSDRKTLHESFETNLAAETADDNLFSFKLYSQPELQNLSEYLIRLKTAKSKQPSATAKSSHAKKTESELLGRIKKSLSWRYPFSEVALLPAKRSVTQLTHHADEFVKFDYSKALEQKPKAVSPPDLISLVDARHIGTAAHLLISKLDLKKPITTESINELKAELTAAQAIDKALAEHIDPQSIMKFFESELGRMVLDANNTVFREWPFTFALPAWHGHPDRAFWDKMSQPQRPVTTDESRDTIIIQGIIDMLIKTPDGLVVIDFKTDAITAKEATQRADFYREQLNLYAEAASAILNLQILSKWLYFLTPRCAVEIKA
jgi:ATP-dependent helicase/nuclease subunit A